MLVGFVTSLHSTVDSHSIGCQVELTLEFPRRPSRPDAAECAFSSDVGHIQTTIVKEARDRSPAVEAIFYRPATLLLAESFAPRCSQPDLQRGDQRLAVANALAFGW